LEQEIVRRAAEKKKVPSKKSIGLSAGLIVDDNSSDEQPLSDQKPQDSARKANPMIVEVEAKQNPAIMKEDIKPKVTDESNKEPLPE